MILPAEAGTAVAVAAVFGIILYRLASSWSSEMTVIRIVGTFETALHTAGALLTVFALISVAIQTTGGIRKIMKEPAAWLLLLLLLYTVLSIPVSRAAVECVGLMTRDLSWDGVEMLYGICGALGEKIPIMLTGAVTGCITVAYSFFRKLKNSR